ncbi:hypothetical protein AVEN_184372-1 [Araneus ventricosus]|uniref:Uncharacterized protein n=1 Tax=Araneus ventricosus TaxID=182803 RepID=A0A4Y2BFH6_ARAVE|nr:hypothetical protein AVEN_184372-1 [Araneus ventricosus]
MICSWQSYNLKDEEDRSSSSVKLTSYFEATLFWDGYHNFELWSDNMDGTSAGNPSPNFRTTPDGGYLAPYDLFAYRNAFRINPYTPEKQKWQYETSWAISHGILFVISFRRSLDDLELIKEQTPGCGGQVESLSFHKRGPRVRAPIPPTNRHVVGSDEH